MSTFTFYPNGPSISTLYCVCPKCSGHNDDVRCEKDFSKREKLLHRFIQPGKNVSLPNSLTLTLTLNAQQNAALLLGSADEEDSANLR